jgi:hypothetical protein
MHILCIHFSVLIRTFQNLKGKSNTNIGKVIRKNKVREFKPRDERTPVQSDTEKFNSPNIGTEHNEHLEDEIFCI